jgi:Protein of unknown function (DUF3631)
MNAEQIAKALGGRKSGSGYIVRCVAHDDENPSMSIADGDKGGIVVKCHAGCDQRELMHVLMSRGLWPEKTNGSKQKNGKQIISTYDYTDPQYKLVHQVVRYSPKGFSQRRPDGKGGWIWSMGQIERMPYRLPDVIEAIKANEIIFIAEGEKDCDSLANIGITATTNPEGAGKWQACFAKWFAGARVVILPDNDDPGRAHAKQVKSMLENQVAEVRILELPGLPAKGDVSDWLAACGTREELLRLASAPADQPAEQRVGATGKINGAELLNDVRAFIARFVVFPEPHHLDAVTLWAVHAHAIAEFYTTPRLAMVSVEAESGKTRVLEILSLITPNAMMCFTPSVAAIFRKLDQEQITLLLDETDTIFSYRGKDDQNEDLRALLNAGYRRGASIPRCTGRNHEVTDFKVFAATALAGIGDLPDTIMTRSIIIRMKRRAAGEHIEQYRARDVDPEGHALRDRLAAWASIIGAEAGKARLDLPGVTDRRAEAWEPLIAIADLAGGDWPQRARAAAVADVTSHRGREGSLGVRLLADLKTVFEDREAMSTSAILEALVGMDDAPWGDLKGKALDARGLALRLKRYGIARKTIRIGMATAKGYSREDMHDAWKRYLPTHPIGEVTGVTEVTNGVISDGDVPDVTDVTEHRRSVPETCQRCAGEGCKWCEPPNG